MLVVLNDTLGGDDGIVPEASCSPAMMGRRGGTVGGDKMLVMLGDTPGGGKVYVDPLGGGDSGLVEQDHRGSIVTGVAISVMNVLCNDNEESERMRQSVVPHTTDQWPPLPFPMYEHQCIVRHCE